MKTAMQEGRMCEPTQHKLLIVFHNLDDAKAEKHIVVLACQNCAAINRFEFEPEKP